MKRFVLERRQDVTGVSGVGTVAEGVQFTDGRVSLRWIVGEHRSTFTWDGIESVEKIHGHDGATTVRWLDADEPPADADGWHRNVIVQRLEVPPALPAPPPAPAPRDSAEHSCERCGRVGYRRFVKTATGWECAPTARCGDRPAVTKHAGPKPLPSPLQAVKAEPPPAPRQPIAAPGVTARCRDCSRSWTLSGRVLRQSAEMHELKHSHIVEVL